MFHSKFLRLGALATLTGAMVCTLHAGSLGTSGTLYLIAPDQQTGFIVSGTTATSFALNGNQESPVAVYSGMVSTTGFAIGAAGSNYNRDGSLISGGINAGAASAFDGTTDGSHNYVVDFYSGNVYQMTPSWTSPTVLFTAAGASPLGITYDSADRTLWISDFFDSSVNEYTLGGTLLGGFSTGHSANTALAYDSTDNSLWLVNDVAHSPLQLEQYSLDGTYLQTMTFASLSGNNVLGGEFAMATPEPGTILFGGIGLAMLGISRLRRHSPRKN